MPGPFPLADTVISPIIGAIANLIQTQVENTPVYYPFPPDGAPDDNSFIIALDTTEIKGETNAKLDLVLSFKLFHFTRHSSFGDNLAFLYTIYFPYIQVLSAWANQDLGGLARAVTPKKVKVTQVPYSNEPRVAIVLDFEVETEFNIPLD